MTATTPALAFDPGSPDFARDPYRVYAQLRSHGEPYFEASMNTWLLSRYSDVDAAATNPLLVRGMDCFMTPEEIAAQRRVANWHDMPNHERLVQVNLLESDGVDHRRLRMLVMREFTRHYVARHRAVIQRHVDALLDELLARGEIDFIADLAAHVPGYIIGHVLGVPDADCPQLRIWSENVVQFFDVGRTDAHKQLAEQATTEFQDYLLELVAQRRRQPRDDLLSTLIRAQDAGELNETELIATSMLILMAGHGSTIDVLGCGLNALLEHPEQMQRLRAQPQHIHTAVQEMFRYESPLPFFHRYASKDMTLFGRALPAGTRFGLLYGSANRDPDAFPDAHRFDVTRTPNRHVAFGRGAHLCLGNHLSRLDMEVIFLTLLARTRSIERTTDALRYRPGLSTRGLLELRVRFTPT